MIGVRDNVAYIAPFESVGMTNFWELWVMFNAFRRAYEITSISVLKCVLFWPTGKKYLKKDE